MSKRLVKEVPADTKLQYTLVQWVVRRIEILTSVSTVYMREHYIEASMLQLEVSISIQMWIVTNLCTARIGLLYTKSTDSRYVLWRIITCEVTTVNTKVNIQHTCYLESYKQITICVKCWYWEYICLT